MAGAMGAIVIREDERGVHWRKKCDRCGFVDSSTHISNKLQPHTTLRAGSFCCPKCSHQSEVAIYG